MSVGNPNPTSIGRSAPSSLIRVGDAGAALGRRSRLRAAASSGVKTNSGGQCPTGRRFSRNHGFGVSVANPNPTSKRSKWSDSVLRILTARKRGGLGWDGEVRGPSEPEALLAVLKNPAYHFKRIGLEAGPLSQWLYSALAEVGLPVICVETRHMRAVLKAQINKTDRNDARGMAQMIRVGLYRAVHVKTLRSQKLRMLLTHRKLLQSKAIAIENDLRGTLRNFGLKVGMHRRLLAIVRDDEEHSQVRQGLDQLRSMDHFAGLDVSVKETSVCSRTILPVSSLQADGETRSV